MNKTKQFRALFKFQTTVNPFIWFMPLVFGVPLFLPLLTGSILSKTYHPSLETLLMIQNLFFVGFLGAMIMAPEKFQFGGANLVSSYYGSEFLLTRAIDRPVLYRAKAALLYLLILSLPFIAIIHALKSPDLIVNEYSKPVQQECLTHVPGSAFMPDESKRLPTLISIPRGNVLVTEWQFWMFLISAVTLQMLLVLLYPFKYGKFVFWIFFFGMIFAPLYMTLHTIGTTAPSFNERLFFSFTAHQALFWILTALGFIVAQLWCERRFARLEQ